MVFLISDNFSPWTGHLGRVSACAAEAGVQEDVQGAVAAITRLGGGAGGQRLTEVTHPLKPVTAAQLRLSEEADSVTNSHADTNEDEEEDKDEKKPLPPF